MALQPILFSTTFIDDMNAYMSIDASGLTITTAPGVVKPSIGDFPNSFASAYETYSLTGEVLGAVHGAQELGIIEAYLKTFSNTVIDFATALANYWATVLIVPGIPAHGGISVLSVSNDAASQVSAFASAITASLTSEYQLPLMKTLIDNIEAIALPTITWTVIEIIPTGAGPVPTPFIEKVL